MLTWQTRAACGNQFLHGDARPCSANLPTMPALLVTPVEAHGEFEPRQVITYTALTASKMARLVAFWWNLRIERLR
jgi:hypothetical protein